MSFGNDAKATMPKFAKLNAPEPSHFLLEKRRNMPYCHHRAEQLQREGKRERLVLIKKVPREPFDFGRFEPIEENIPTEGLFSQGELQ